MLRLSELLVAEKSLELWRGLSRDVLARLSLSAIRAPQPSGRHARAVPGLQGSEEVRAGRNCIDLLTDAQRAIKGIDDLPTQADVFGALVRSGKQIRAAGKTGIYSRRVTGSGYY